MKVLFLGGPWHEQRREVTPRRLAAAADTLPTQYTVPLQTGAEPVTYTRRYARSQGERLPVYVAPDYSGPARA
ncbi:hypothetical protein O7632_08015 [Solwaraspora sp. WMMD406]|uniref:hypothetical protein n=1 Tax=Solwaraspora sp. WMMD406 TaxID=3016095 RepID=UPI002416482D|nr:hypothetical protein [Solwaraspora sp. WMMD406]MDG4764050.1 hypothetical protein [Solwaraspora sp. WMMD406]